MRFVILEHRLPAHSHPRALHWDLMLERDDVLRTWALAQEPEIGKTCDATQLADHRLDYLEYEGPVSHDRGSVTRWDSGTYVVLQSIETSILLELEAVNLGAVRVRLDGTAESTIWRCEIVTQ